LNSFRLIPKAMNNKIWSWTEKQKSKRIRSRRLGQAPKCYRRMFWKKNRMNNREALIKELNSESGSFSLRTERHNATYCWW